jgi:hypothetical protein
MRERPENGKIALIILQAVKNMQTGEHGLVGKQTLVPFLQGSRSKRMLRGRMHELPDWGALYWEHQDTISDYLDQLRFMLLLRHHKHSGPYWSYYTLVLTAAGETVLQEQTIIPLNRKISVPTMKTNDSAEETLRLLREGLLPETVARRRTLALSTIFTHCFALISTGKLHAREIVPEDRIRLILEAKRKSPYARSLKEYKEILPEEIEYDEIKCVLADKTLIPKSSSISAKYQFIDASNDTVP